MKLGDSTNFLLWSFSLTLPIVVGLPIFREYRAAAPLQQLEQELKSISVLVRGRREPSTNPVILGIDDTSLSLDVYLTEEERSQSPLLQMMGPWPWPRSLQAELAAFVLERGARGVVFNIIFASPSAYGPEDDQYFEQRLEPWKRQITLAADLERSSQNGVDQQNLIMPIWQWPNIGITTLLLSNRGQALAIPGQRWKLKELATLPKPHPDALAFVANQHPPSQSPLDLPFVGGEGSWPVIPAWQIEKISDDFWQDRLVLIGVTSSAMGHQQETPFGPLSGSEVQAVAIAAVADGNGVLPVSPFLETIFFFSWTSIALFFLHRAKSTRTIITTASTLFLFSIVAAGISWIGFNAWLAQAPILTALLLGSGTRGAQLWLKEQRERNDLRRVLDRRVSPRLLKKILKDPEKLGTQLVGQKCQCVVLFTDLVGFTSLSAQLEPESLFKLLNQYFDGLSKAVIDENGLLDKFIGDALMAEFGIPESRGNLQEALAAIRAAVQMQSSLEKLNQLLRSENRPTLSQGIGLHFGEVIAGNLGSENRMEFTVIGSTVNVASRLEGLTRRFSDYPILISGELRELLGNAVETIDLGPQMVKGWPEPVQVHGLIRLHKQKTHPEQS